MGDTWKEFALWIKCYPEVLIFAVFSLGAIGGFAFVKWRNSGDVEKITGFHEKADAIISDIFTNRNEDVTLLKNLKGLYAYSSEAKKTKLHLAIEFQSFFIACYTLGTFFIILTALIAFVVTKKGWDTSSRTRKGLLLSSTFYGVIFTTFPKLFNQEQNYKANFASYTVLRNNQLYMYKSVTSILNKSNVTVDLTEIKQLNTVMDSATNVLIRESGLNINIDTKALDIGTMKIQSDM